MITAFKPHHPVIVVSAIEDYNLLNSQVNSYRYYPQKSVVASLGNYTQLIEPPL